MRRLNQFMLYVLYMLDMLHITWVMRVIKFWVWASWYKIHFVNGKSPTYGSYVIINYFYLVNDNHTIAQFRSYDPYESISKFTIDDVKVDIKERTVNGQDVFLDDISLI